MFNFSQFLANNIHEQFLKITIEGMFKHASVLVYMFLFYQAERFPIALQKLDEQDNAQLVIQWTSFVQKNSNNFSSSDFINQFIYIVACLLNNNVEPRIGSKIQRTLHLSEQVKMGHWYLYQNYTEIRVYGCELPPYKLRKYVPMRIFSFEYIRQMINMDDLHFVSAKKKAQFKIKTQVGPFICNIKAASNEADALLKQMNFQLSFTWSYDPFSIISSLRVEQKTTPYTHTPGPEIEKFMNQDLWEENTLREAEEHVMPTTTSQTPLP